MAETLASLRKIGGGTRDFSTPVMVTVPANGTYNISASGVTKVILTCQDNDMRLLVVWEDGVNKYQIINNNLIVNPTLVQLNQYITYVNNTITVHSMSGAARNVYVMYM